jgi:hypothetical protein
VTVYLDVWERHVSGVEDPALVLFGLGTESCVRLRREWAVHTRTGTTLPKPGESAYREHHVYVELARIARVAGVLPVRAADVTDRRQQRLLMPPAALLHDVYGSPGGTLATAVGDARARVKRPPVSYRTALNALVRGRLPGGPEVELPAPAAAEIALAIRPDRAGHLIALLGSTRAHPGTPEIDLYATRAPLANPAAGFETPAQLTSAANLTGAQLGVVGANDLVVVYCLEGARVAFRRGSFAGLAGAQEQVIATGSFEAPVVAITGTTAIFVWFDRTAGAWRRRRFDLASGGAFLDTGPLTLQIAHTDTGAQVTSVVDAAGTAWFALESEAQHDGLQVVTVTAAGATTTASPVFAQTFSGDQLESPSLLIDSAGAIHLVWSGSDTGLWHAAHHAGTWSTPELIAGTRPGDAFVQAVADPTGGFWLAWSRTEGGPPATYVMWHNPSTRGWTPPRLLTSTPLGDLRAILDMEPDGSMWVAWARTMDAAASTHVFLKRVHTTI